MSEAPSSLDHRSNLSVRIPAVAYWEAQRQCWVGVIPGLSLFVEAGDFSGCGVALFERLQECIADALRQGREHELVPHPLPRDERRRLNKHLARLKLRWKVGQYLPIWRMSHAPVMRFNVHWYPTTPE